MSTEEENEDDVYDVEEILGMADIGGETNFLIRWKGYDSSHDSLEPYYNLQANEKIQEYLKSVGENIRAGGYKRRRLERKETEILKNENFVSASQVMSAIKRYSKRLKVDGNQLTCVQFRGISFLDEEDRIYIHLFRGHFYVYFLKFKSNEYFVLDGENAALENKDLRDELSECVGKELKPIKFSQQYCMDHCGSAAVAIALELMRLYRYKKVPDQLEITFKETYKEIRKSLHKGESQALNTRKQIQEQIINKTTRQCGKCNRSFKKSKMALLAHQRLCRGR